MPGDEEPSWPADERVEQLGGNDVLRKPSVVEDVVAGVGQGLIDVL